MDDRGDHGRTDGQADDPAMRMVRRQAADEQTLTDRLSLHFYKMTWRTPLHNMRLTGKVPLRLLATPVDPLPRDIARGQAVRMGQFHYRGERHDLDGLDYENTPFHPCMADYIHRFDWLRDLAAALPNYGEGAPIASAITQKWIAGNSNRIREPAWRIDNSMWRLVNMAASAPYILSSRDPIYRSKVINHLARTARHLDQSTPRAAPGLPRLAGWVGIIAASLLLPEGEARRSVGENGIAKALAELVMPDGGIASRSPLQLMEMIRMLVMLRQCYAARQYHAPVLVEEHISRMTAALLGICHGNGDLGAWQGSGHLPAGTIRQLADIADPRARGQNSGDDWGYQRVSAGDATLIFDAAPPPLARQLPAGCASSLAFEFSHGKENIILNCGGSAILNAEYPADLATGLRSTAAHSTLCMGNSNSTAILPGGQLGRGVEQVVFERRDIENATRIEARHDGYVRPFGHAHIRALTLSADGLVLKGQDMLLPQGRAAEKGDTPFNIHFHLGPGIEIMPGDDAETINLRLSDGSIWSFWASEGELALDDSLFVDGEGHIHPTQQLIISAKAGKGGRQIDWQYKFLG